MRNMMQRIGRVALLVGAVLPGVGHADDSLVFRLMGFYQGPATISQDGIRCTIPTVSNAIPTSSFRMGLWRSAPGFETIAFPDPNNGFADPCGGYVQVQNNMTHQGVSIERISFRRRIMGPRRFREVIPTRRGWPLSCQDLRKSVVFGGTHLQPAGSDEPVNSSGRPNVSFENVAPFLDTNMIECLRNAYLTVPATDLPSLPVRIRATVYGRADNGDSFVSNTVSYSVNFTRTCGNGRVEPDEECDPAASVNVCASVFDDPASTCIPANDPLECFCIPPPPP